VLAEMERRLIADGAKRVAARANEDDALRIAAIVGRGFVEDRRSRRWVLELGENRDRIERMTRQSRDRMRDEGIELVTLDREQDPEKYRKVWRMNEEAAQDVPTTLPIVEGTFEDTMRWLRNPACMKIVSGSRARVMRWSACRCSSIRRCAASSAPPGPRPTAACVDAASPAR
jgi:hypothetical protein